jgi:hypothetical protein
MDHVDEARFRDKPTSTRKIWATKKVNNKEPEIKIPLFLNSDECRLVNQADQQVSEPPGIVLVDSVDAMQQIW